MCASCLEKATLHVRKRHIAAVPNEEQLFWSGRLWPVAVRDPLQGHLLPYPTSSVFLVAIKASVHN